MLRYRARQDHGIVQGKTLKLKELLLLEELVCEVSMPCHAMFVVAVISIVAQLDDIVLRDGSTYG